MEECNLVGDETKDGEYGKYRRVKFAEFDKGESSEVELYADPNADLSAVPVLRPVSVELRVSASVGRGTRLTLVKIEKVKAIEISEKGGK